MKSPDHKHWIRSVGDVAHKHGDTSYSNPIICEGDLSSHFVQGDNHPIEQQCDFHPDRSEESDTEECLEQGDMFEEFVDTDGNISLRDLLILKASGGQRRRIRR